MLLVWNLPMYLPSVVCAGAAIFSLVSWSLAEDWTRFRGPDGTGISKTAGLPTTISETYYAWTKELGGTGHSCPVVFGKRLFLTLATGMEPPSRDIVCFDTKDGKELWRKSFPYKVYNKHNLNSFASATPAVDAKGVYVFWGEFEQSEVVAFDHEGNELWRTPLGPYQCQHGSGMGLVAEDGVLIVPKENVSEESFVAGLETATGKVLWKSVTPSAMLKNDGQGGGDLVPYTTPTIRRHEGKAEAIFSNTKRGVYALDVKTGAERWKFDPQFAQRCIASPLLMGDIVFVTCGQGDGGKNSVAFSIPTAGGEPKELYRVRKGLPYVPTPIHLDGLLFLLSDTGVVSCVDAKSGEDIWRERVTGPSYASPVCINGVLYLFGRKGEVAIIEAGRALKKISEGTLPEGVNATPAVADGRLFIRTDKRLICLTSAS